MGSWASEFIFFGCWKDRKRNSINTFPPKFSSTTLILDGKAIPLQRFCSKSAESLYLPEILTRKDYMCYKHKPPQMSMLIQVCWPLTSLIFVTVVIFIIVFVIVIIFVIVFSSVVLILDMQWRPVLTSRGSLSGCYWCDFESLLCWPNSKTRRTLEWSKTLEWTSCWLYTGLILVWLLILQEPGFSLSRDVICHDGGYGSKWAQDWNVRNLALHRQTTNGLTDAQVHDNDTISEFRGDIERV